MDKKDHHVFSYLKKIMFKKGFKNSLLLEKGFLKDSLCGEQFSHLKRGSTWDLSSKFPDITINFENF